MRQLGESRLIIWKEVQVGVVGLDLDIGMKLSMSRIPYEGARAVCEAAENSLRLLHCRRDTAVQPFKHLSMMIQTSQES